MARLRERIMADLARTPFHAQHQALGGRLVDFAGWHMPLHYSAGITAEHNAVRGAVGVFDVSHMGEFSIRGDRALDFLDRLLTNDPRVLVDGQAQYTAMCMPDGGIVDDLLIYRVREDLFYACVNAANIDKDWEWFQKQNGVGAELANESDDWAQLALQGPRAEATLQQLTDAPLADLVFYHLVWADVAGVPCMISRTGYTGEDGFEILIPAPEAPPVLDAVLDAGSGHGILPVGLGCRDTLRLEMKYALYGNDIGLDTHPLEAGLGWITKLKRPTDFLGKAAMQEARSAGLTRRLVGFKLSERAVPRPGYPVLIGGEQVGEVRSGALSPSLGVPIGTAYIPVGMHRPGTELEVQVRKRRIPGTVVKTPFYQRPS